MIEALPQNEPEKGTEFLGIQIEGDPDFIERTEEALGLLEHVPAFAEVHKYLGKIRQAEHSGMWVMDETPTFDVGDPTSSHSPIWYASGIAHDGYHSRLYRLEKERIGGKGAVSAYAWAGTEAESKCMEYQVQILEQLGADKNTIEYVKSQMANPTHHGTSVMDFGAYDKRNW